MITQDVDITRRIMQEAKTLAAAGYDVGILARAGGTEDHSGHVEGIPVEWLAVKGRDPRFGWVYRLAGLTRGSQAVALWSVLTGKHTFTKRALSPAIEARAHIYHAHDLNNLEVAYHAAKAQGTKLVYDAHELFPDMANRWVRLKRKSWLGVEAKLLPHANLTITVNKLIAAEMARRHNVPPPLVLLNCPDPPPGFDATTRHDLIRQRLSLPPESKIALYQGWMSEGRGLESLVRAASLLVENAVVVFMGYGEYEQDLKRMAAQQPPGRVHFLPAVPQPELLPYCASADVGVIPYQAVDLNNYYTSPNKLFDFIQAAVPIVANDLPYLRQVIAGYNIGLVAKLDSPETYARAINHILTLPDNAAEIRSNLLKIAPTYTWQAQAKKLIEAYEGLGVGD